MPGPCLLRLLPHCQVLKIARKLFKVVNADEACCADCPYRHLSKMDAGLIWPLISREPITPPKKITNFKGFTYCGLGRFFEYPMTMF